MSVWLPTASCTPESCLTDPAPTVALPRRVLRLTACLLVLATGLALTRPASTLPRGPRDLLARFWARTLLGSLGVAVRIAPTPDDRPDDRPNPQHSGVLLVANHVSWLDIPLIAAVRPGRSLAKTEVRHWPVLGRMVSWGGTVFLDRDRLRTLPGTVSEVAALLRDGHPMVVFPEGSTWCGRESGRFRPAFFEAAVRAGAPVQPMTIRYRLADGRATSAPAFVGEDGLLNSLARVVAVRGLVAELTFRPPIPAPAPQPGGGLRQARRELAHAAQASVEGVR
ncbi:lysophospholipid acyltransferase family protein [Kitasatospora sp. NPDC058406]|uniref:lysophospholipid acyltransferase family protein n=1 Tax=Kitasatospora sp. NPDC058406 TaxID=3346483 RepID=UPI003663FE6D